MNRSLQALVLCACLLAVGLITAYAAKQHTAPVTHDRHLEKHNPAHPTTPTTNSDRFQTTREGAALQLPKEDDAFTFVVFGDRTGGPHTGINVLAHAVADVNLLEPDLVMTVGDLVNGYADDKVWLPQMKQYKEVMGELACPWFPVAGNHDVYWLADDPPKGELEPLYEQHFGPLWYAFKHKGSTFIALYTDEGDPETGEKSFKKPGSQRMSDAQFNWLRQTLEQAKDSEHVFIFLHHPRWLGSQGRVGYGDGWDNVHQTLVEAGNVSGVFAGHIHHMRYDPKDGIDYFSLATVGGNQPGWAPDGGWSHQFHHVSVRGDKVAFASIPVQGVDDPKLITGEVSSQAELLGRAMPIDYDRPLKINDDGSVDDTLTVTIKNPSGYPVYIELKPTSKDSRWSFAPEDFKTEVKPGGSVRVQVRFMRPPGRFDTTARPVVMQLAIDMLTERLRVPIPAKRLTVPGSLRVDAE